MPEQHLPPSAPLTPASGASGATRARRVVLVEGLSDQVALECLAHRRGQNLSAEGVAIVAMGGATNIGRWLDLLGPAGAGMPLAGLYDAAEERHFERGLERVGLGCDARRTDGAHLEERGFFRCVDDLEDELIRALGPAAVEEVIRAAGDRGPWCTFQKQPAQRGRDSERQLRRFMGTRSGRKIEYARLLVERLDLAQAPQPLDAVLDYVS